VSATISPLCTEIVKSFRQTPHSFCVVAVRIAWPVMFGIKMSDYLKSLLLASVVITAPAVAVETEETVEELVVTASRRAQPLSNVGASISIIGEQALQQGQYAYVADALQSLPSLAVNSNGAFGGQTAISIRGADTAQTVILIDGIQMNDVSSPGGAFNFGTLDTNGIERIEVLKGPQAVLYGSDAIGGVVNIITKTGGEDGFGGGAYAEYGAFRSFRGGANVFGGNDNFGFNLSGGFSDSEGISKADAKDGNTEKDGNENVTLRGRLTAKFSEGFELEAFGSYSDSETDTDSFGPKDGPDQALSEEYLVGARAHIDLADGRFNNTVSVEFSGIDRASVSAFGTFAGKGRRFNLDYLGIYTLTDGLFLTAGAQHESVKAETVDPNAIDINSVFGVLAYEKSGFSVSAGLRYDDHETFGGTTNGQLRAAYSFTETGTKIFANWGEGFKAPSINQLTYICTFCGLTEPASDLRPEQSNAWEIGVEQSAFDGDFKIGATYFNQKTKDLIIFDFAAGYVNVDRTRSRGLELSLDATLSDTLHFNASYTYNSAKDTIADTRLIRRPKNKFYAAATWDVTDRFSTNISITHNGEILDTGARTVGSWTVFDLRASYKLVENVELYGRVNNLFDAEYQVITGYGTPGAASYFGVRVIF